MSPLATVKPEDVKVALMPISDIFKIGLQLCLIVSDISSLLHGSSSPGPDTERLFR